MIRLLLSLAILLAVPACVGPKPVPQTWDVSLYEVPEYREPYMDGP